MRLRIVEFKVEASVLIVALLAFLSAAPVQSGDLVVGPLEETEGLEIPLSGAIVGAWIDGEPTSLDETGRLPLAPGYRQLGVVTERGQVYATGLTIDKVKGGLRIVPGSWHGPDIQRERVRTRELNSPPDFMTLSGDFLLLWESGRLFLYDPYELRLLRTITTQRTLLTPATFKGELHFLEYKKKTSGTGRTKTRKEYYRVVKYDLEAEDITAITAWVSADWAALITDGPSAVLVTNGPKVYWFSGDELSRVSFELAKPLSKRIKWREAALSGTWLVFPTLDGELVGINTAGEFGNWQVSLGHGINEMSPCGDAIIARDSDGTLSGIDTDAREIVWTRRRLLKKARSLVCLAGRLYHLAEPNLLISMSAKSGTEEHRLRLDQLGLKVADHLRVVGEDGLFLEGVDGGVTLLDLNFGFPVVIGETQKPVQQAASNGSVLVLVTGKNQLVNFAVPGARELAGWIGDIDMEQDVARLRIQKAPLSELVVAPSRWLMEGSRTANQVHPASEVFGELAGPGVVSIRNPSVVRRGSVLLYDGTLELAIEPEDAFVWVDNRYVGRGRQILQGIHRGAHDVRVVHPDRHGLSRTIEVTRQPFRLAESLESPKEGVLIVKPDVKGAKIFLDGDLVGLSPLSEPIYDLEAGRVVEVKVRKLGLETARAQMVIKEGVVPFEPRMKLAPLLGRLFVSVLGTEPVVRGWPNEGIERDRVVGEPVRSSAGEGRITGSFEVPLKPVGFFGQFEGGTGSLVEIEGGLRVELFRNRELGSLHAGFSYSERDAESSHPPCEERTGRTCKRNDDAPLEEWSHPIDRVKVSNSSRSYARFSLIYRPQTRLFVEASYAKLLAARLRGVALVEGEDGHLVESDRSYSLAADGGQRVELKVQVPLTSLIGTRRVKPSLALEFGFRESEIGFGDFSVRDESFSLGIGLFGFLDRGKKKVD